MPSMETFSLSRPPFIYNPLHRRPSTFPATFPGGNSKKPVGLAASKGGDAYGYESGGGGRLVDENMVVLRKRIHEMRISESPADEPPSEWTEWEKQYYRNYGSDVCEVVGLLQVALMNTRPSVAIGVMAVVTLSLPTLMILLLLHVIQLGTH